MLRTLIDNLPDLIYVKDANGRFLLANPRSPASWAQDRHGTCWERMTSISSPRKWPAATTKMSSSVIRSGNPLLEREENAAIRRAR